MKHYYVELTANYIPKNKAHEVIQNFASEFHGTLTDETGKETIKGAIGNRLKEVNAAFPRCKNIELSGWIHSNESISVDGNFILVFKEVKHYILITGESSQLKPN